MFLGTYITNFSGKGRLILSKKFRLELDEAEMVLMRGLDGGIWGFSKEGWLSFSQAQLTIPLTEKKGRELRRELFPYAEKCELDSQGRFVIPEFLLKIGKIGDKVVLIGAGDHFEIWSYSLWKELIGGEG
jgi:MraZ protein